MMTADKCLIVNADDFGQSRSVNRGVITAHEHGIVTSASLMVRWPNAGDAAAYGRKHPEFSLGLHLDLGEWRLQQDNWVPVYEVVSLKDRTRLADEVSRQLAAFRSLVGKDPSHLDSHQHVHVREPLCGLVTALGRELGIPVRRCTSKVAYRGDFYGQTANGEPFPLAIRLESLVALVNSLGPGFTELACHPGQGDDDLDTMYRAERRQEVEVLCHPQVRAALGVHGIQLCSFAAVPRESRELISTGSDR